MSKSPWKYIKGNPLDLIAELQKYTDEKVKRIQKVQYKLSRQAHKELKEKSPRGNRTEKHYADGWRIKREYKDGTAELTLIIHNTNKPGLTHLLENGHLGRDGKRVKAKEHIKPVQEELNQKFIKAVEEILEDGD